MENSPEYQQALQAGYEAAASHLLEGFFELEPAHRVPTIKAVEFFEDKAQKISVGLSGVQVVSD